MDNLRKDSITVDMLKNACLKWDYAFFESGNYNINIIGIRNINRHANSFDDFMCIYYLVDGQKHFNIYPCTTDPGSTYLTKPLTEDGCAIIVPYQYRKAYQLGLHKNQYLALCQTGAEVAIYRDNNKDVVLDYDPRRITHGFFGTNIHRSSPTGTSTEVNNWSAGCQVFANINDFNDMISAAQASSKLYGNSFTYTLFDARQL